ncbi:alpha/beta hydrolase [Gilvimarinus agarilyticus]|uniref:alpha/beta fold hydrolase n=1 Tax=Gilvimarinus sp. 2_MG-2023 TaxID=3062666 RepID=UPI001C08B672|nr:alpha/beta hydrolase [Gilvimarinus sp. 2_MG-2023]MBU2885688.1 alpha/beta hydrolase [Gilvimarinus agarilyticus]MDO6570548.1 alpha/beta hydrolase [Gilvimarinus sp. 2_MG-2023]
MKIFNVCIRTFFLPCLVCLGVAFSPLVWAETEQATIEENLPQGWRTGYETEPVFGSKMFWVEAGRKNSETIVLIHGLGQNGWRDWRKVMPLLAQEYRVVAFDLPGFGRSEVPTGKYSPSNYAAAVHSVLHQAGIKQFHLVGHSMGGAVALRLATRYPTSVERLVLISAAGILERSTFAGHSTALPLEAGMLSYFNALPKEVQGGISGLVREIGGSILRWDALPDPTALLSKSDTAWGTTLKGQPNMNAAFALVGEDYSGDLTTLDVPTLVLWGEQDPVAPLRTGYLLAGQIPDAELEIFPGMGHMPILYPDLVGPPITNFLQSKTSVSSSAGSEENHGDYQCSGQSGVQLSGHYQAIEINDCQNVFLQDVTANSLQVNNSKLVGRNVNLGSSAIGLQADNAEIELTNAHIQGDIAVSVNASQLDLAGVLIEGESEAVRAYQASEFVFSVSQMQTPDYQKNLHGVFTLGAPAQ